MITIQWLIRNDWYLPTVSRFLLCMYCTRFLVQKKNIYFTFILMIILIINDNSTYSIMKILLYLLQNVNLIYPKKQTMKWRSEVNHNQPASQPHTLQCLKKQKEFEKNINCIKSTNEINQSLLKSQLRWYW